MNATQAQTTAPATEVANPSTEVKLPPSHSISEATYVSTLASAFSNSRYALQLEMATCLSVFYEHSNVSREAKQTLMRIYNQAGFACESPLQDDYKTTSRRVNVGALLYTHIGHEQVGKWCEGKMEMMLISSIVDGLAQYSLKTIDGILSFVGKPRAKQKAAEEARIEPSPEARAYAEKIAGVALTAEKPAQPAERRAPIAEGAVAEEQHGPMQEHLYRRASDFEYEPMDDPEAARYQEWLALRGETPMQNIWEIQHGYKHITTEHIRLSIPPETSKSELVAAALRLMEMANALADGAIVGELPPNSVAVTNGQAAGEPTGIPTSLLKEPSPEAAPPAEEPPPMDTALRAALKDLLAKTEEHSRDEIEETPEEIAAHQKAHDDALEAKKNGNGVPPAPSRFRKSTPKVPKQ